MARPIATMFADSHLDVETWTGRPIRGDSMFAFQYVLNYTEERKVTDIIGAGDLIDVRRPPSEVIDFMRGGLRKAAKKGIRLLFTSGQHDLAHPPWFSAVAPDNTVWLHKKTACVDDFSLYGLDWTPADRLSEELGQVPEGTHIFVCHQVWEEFMGDVTSPEGSLTQVPHASTIITGDYHKYVVLKPEESKLRGANNQKITVYSPGATCIRKIDEPAEHYMLILYDDGVIKRRAIPSRPVKRVVILNMLDLEMFVSKWKSFNREPNPELPEELQTPLLHVEYPADMPEIKTRIDEVYGNLAHIFWKARQQETEEQTQRRTAGRELRAKGPAGCLKLVVPERDVRHAPLLRLINAGNPKAELIAMKKERGL